MLSRVIILEDGFYFIQTHATAASAGSYFQYYLKINGALSTWSATDTEANESGGIFLSTTSWELNYTCFKAMATVGLFI